VTELNVPDLQTYLARWSALHGRYDARSSRVVSAWLALTYAVARPLAAARVSPGVVTLGGVLASGVVAALAGLAGGQRGWLWVAALVAAGSGLLDSLDGAVAVLVDRVTRWGAVLDSVADRVSDGLYLLALWLAGAAGPVCVAAGALTVLQEYARARAGAVGVGDIGVVTVSERPTRVIVTAASLAVGAVYGGAAANVGAGAWSALSLIGCVQLGVDLRRRLSGS
jgi:phosphatidylglycerophosphate synthase